MLRLHNGGAILVHAENIHPDSGLRCVGVVFASSDGHRLHRPGTVWRAGTPLHVLSRGVGRIGYAAGFCATDIMSSIIAFAAAGTTPAFDHPRPDRRVDGNPQRTTWEHYARQGLSSGIWACEVGSWHIRFADNRDEFFCVIAGRVRLHAETGGMTEFGPGDAGVIPAGFVGRFEVVEAVRKYFVVVDQ
ncbi:cupin domain-containing protein [Jeongeupia chitinilytica]|uniref:(S)-ureidoglycine aminohydrolase cupin domain-containing protein n=1 Tax=Jeongeupia chitinilytica TaxID=1041641 RepID=A0ABQ3GZF5_9NEIS|nr:cupin domain-containing protein [Jeongeupia chitinilytica]GHD60081.1 hypothetical protein GCM10007350_12480 [Jeongeupia chitinilytica]